MGAESVRRGNAGRAETSLSGSGLTAPGQRRARRAVPRGRRRREPAAPRAGSRLPHAARA